MENVVEIENVSVYYDHVIALSDINLTIKDKDFLGILGPNGGGKSTLLKTILGLLKPATGSIRVFGSPPHKVGGLIGYVPQASKFAKSFPINVWDVVLTGRLRKKNCLFRRYTLQDKEAVRELLNRLNIYDLRDRQIGRLSAGQLQRVLIARALALEPKIILLDEPTASLDSKSRTQIYSILSELNKYMTIILVTHDMGAVSSYVKSIACLNTKLYYHGEPELNSTLVSKIYGCPVDLIAHGVPHRVLQEHEEGNYA
ncbi:MAG: zinc transport system ATP-binding protein [Clostridia bacterium]|jgi:zinc transport system ATP-binding protein|nr:metal transporter ATP-binding protein [Clostridiales bacterium]MDK2985041.1 zinc transport system ATP-binding protein [Clostridia bacterium]